jgi:Homeodomain-like domain
MEFARMLAYVTGTVDQELLARNEYLATENRILKAHLNGRPRLSDAERAILGEIGHRLGRKVLSDVATVAQPDTILGWYRKLVARKFDGSKARQGPGRPRIKREVEQLIVRMASENRDWGYDRIVGALANLGYEVSDQTVGNVCAAAYTARARAQAHDHLGDIHSGSPGGAGRDRLFHGGGADAARIGDLLRAVFHPSGEPEGGHRRDHRPSERTVDEADGP